MGVNESSLVMTVNEPHELGMITWHVANAWPKMSERGRGSKWRAQLSLACTTPAGARQRWNLPKWLDGGPTPLCFAFEIQKSLRVHFNFYWCICVCLCVPQIYVCVHGGQKGASRSPGAEVKRGCEPCNKSAGNQARVLCKSKMYFEPSLQLMYTSPSFLFLLLFLPLPL